MHTQQASQQLVRIIQRKKETSRILTEPGVNHRQEILIDTTLSTLSSETAAAYRIKLRGECRAANIDKIMADNQLDVIIGTMAGRLLTLAAVAGYPIGTAHWELLTPMADLSELLSSQRLVGRT